jgi:hypothetical protein
MTDPPLVLSCSCGWRDANTAATVVPLFDDATSVWCCPDCATVLAGMVGPDLTAQRFGEHPDLARLCGMEAGPSFAVQIVIAMHERLTLPT